MPYSSLSRRSPQKIHSWMLALAAAVLTCIALPASAQTYTVLYDFTHQNDPSYFQYAGSIPQGRDGKLYATSHEGGTAGIGTFFSMTTSGSEATLYSFDGSKGSYPNFGVILASDGNFYGSTPLGGGSNLGVVYKATSAGVVTVLHTFTGGANGSGSGFPPTQGSDGNFYGTSSTTSGATPLIFQLTPAGGFKILHSLSNADGYDGGSPLQATDGNFYGVGQLGGANNCGTFYKVTKTGVYKVLHSFTCTDGKTPFTQPVQAADGNFYGITFMGGTTNDGVIYKVTTAGKLTVLHNLKSATDGSQSQAGLTLATDGNLYGTAYTGGPTGYGTIFKVTTAGVFTVLHSFDGSTDIYGDFPGSNLTQHTNGLFYGDTYLGPGNGTGVFYSLNVGLAPFAKLAAASGVQGATIGIFGQGFLSATSVTFGGVATTFTKAGDNYLTAKVPVGAPTGSVVVVMPKGNLTSSQIFSVTPTVASFTPTSGKVGTVVTITGTGLAQTTKVTFHSAKDATFTVKSDRQITATVPTGATTGTIIVTTKGGTATSKTSFTVN